LQYVHCFSSLCSDAGDISFLGERHVVDLSLS
jgi:hypothetical protein